MRRVLPVILFLSFLCQSCMKPSPQLVSNIGRSKKKVNRDWLVDTVNNTWYTPNFGYEQYWKDGEWVIRDQSDWANLNPVTVTDQAGKVVTTTLTPLLCGSECPAAHTRVGMVCAHAMASSNVYNKNGIHGWDEHWCQDWWSYHCGYGQISLLHYANSFVTFKTLCLFKQAQCRDPATNWTLVHKGPCITSPTDIFKSRLPGHMVSRVPYYMAQLQKSLKVAGATLNYKADAFPPNRVNELFRNHKKSYEKLDEKRYPVFGVNGEKLKLS